MVLISSSRFFKTCWNVRIRTYATTISAGEAVPTAAGRGTQATPTAICRDLSDAGVDPQRAGEGRYGQKADKGRRDRAVQGAADRFLHSVDVCENAGAIESR